MSSIPPEYHGWWCIVDTETWVNDGLDMLGPARLSLTDSGDRPGMHGLLAHGNTRPTKTGVSFTWKGAWEYDPVSGSGTARLGKDGKLKGKIKDGDESTFLAERAEEPDEPIADPPSYRDNWRWRESTLRKPRRFLAQSPARPLPPTNPTTCPLQTPQKTKDRGQSSVSE